VDHGVRLPDQPARQGLRRELEKTSRLPSPGIRDREGEPSHRPPDLVSAQGQPLSRQLAIGPDDDGRTQEARVRGVRTLESRLTL